MLNNPNEWHNEDDDMSRDLLGDDYFDDLGDDSEDFSEDGEYEDDENIDDDGSYSDEYGSDDDEEYSEPQDFDENFDEEEYTEEDELEEDDEETGSKGGSSGDDGGLKKKLILASSILLIFLLIMGGIFGMRGMKSKDKKTDDIAQIEKTEEGLDEISIDNEDDLSLDAKSDKKADNTAESGDEVSIDIDVEEEKPADKKQDKQVEENADGGLLVEVDESNALKPEENKQGTFTGKPGDTVTVAIGDIGRKNPFSPMGSAESAQEQQAQKVEQIDYGVNFPVIEPPQLSPEQANIIKLMNTKVAGIMFDPNRPSAIININGVDQLVRRGDVLSGFEMLGIDKNKVVIRCDNNIYRASLGQPLNAEKVVNTVEIANLKSKFYGSNHQ